MRYFLCVTGVHFITSCRIAAKGRHANIYQESLRIERCV